MRGMRCSKRARAQNHLPGIISDLLGVAARFCGFLVSLFAESGSGAPAAAGISDAAVAEWPRVAGCG